MTQVTKSSIAVADGQEPYIIALRRDNCVQEGISRPWHSPQDEQQESEPDAKSARVDVPGAALALESDSIASGYTADITPSSGCSLSSAEPATTPSESDLGVSFGMVVASTPCKLPAHNIEPDLPWSLNHDGEALGPDAAEVYFDVVDAAPTRSTDTRTSGDNTDIMQSSESWPSSSEPATTPPETDNGVSFAKVVESTPDKRPKEEDGDLSGSEEDEVDTLPPPNKKPRRKKGDPEVRRENEDRKSDFHNRKSFRGVPFNRQFITAVYMLMQYFLTEKSLGGPIVGFQKARQRVADALNISRRMVSACVQKVQANCVRTPNKKTCKSSKTRSIDGFTEAAIRNLVYEMARNGRPVAIKDLLVSIRSRKIDFFGGKDTLRKVMRDLGFKFRRIGGRRYLSEKPSIAAKRSFFLRRYMELRLSGLWDFVFLDETWIFMKGSQNGRSWEDCDVRSCPKRGIDKGSRYIVLHAGGREGFIDGMSLVFKSKSTDGDYHGEMNGENFLLWWERLLRKLERPTVIVMDNAPYHSMKTCNQPASIWKKSAIQQWLQKEGIPFSEKMLKPELLRLAKKHRKATEYVADEMARKMGHVVLRLPPYHCQYNPIELVWGIMKRYFEKHIGEYGEFTEDKCFNVWQQAIKKVTPAIWRKVVDKVERLIATDFRAEGGDDNCDHTDYGGLVFDVGGSSDEGSLSEAADESDSQSSDDDESTDPDDPAPPGGESPIRRATTASVSKSAGYQKSAGVRPLRTEAV